MTISDESKQTLYFKVYWALIMFECEQTNGSNTLHFIFCWVNKVWQKKIATVGCFMDVALCARWFMWTKKFDIKLKQKKNVDGIMVLYMKKVCFFLICDESNLKTYGNNKKTWPQ